MPRSTSNFTSDSHAIYAGWVIGLMVKSGLPVQPVADDQGNFTNRVTLTVGESVVTLLIPPPPDDWRLVDAL